VERYVSRLDRRRQREIALRLRLLCEDPYASGISKALHGRLAGQRSSNLGNLRIIYEVDDTIRVLDVVDIGPRGDIYKG
jgi:mRNA interferase RelE/StbE